MTRVRVTRTVLGFLEGTGAWQQPNNDDGYRGEATRLFDRFQSQSKRGDGSFVLDLDDDEVAILTDYAETMEAVARDDAGWNAEARGELNAARALLKVLR